MKTVLTLSGLVLGFFSFSQEREENVQPETPLQHQSQIKSNDRGMVFSAELLKMKKTKLKGVVLEAPEPKETSTTHAKK